MPDFIAQTYKTHPNGKWSNVYRFGAATLAEAVTDMVPILEGLELPILHPDVTLSAVRIATVTPHDDVFEIVPLGLAGTSADSGDLLPFFNCARVDISVIGGGRPSRKYWKGVLTESITAGMNLASGVQGLITSQFNAAIAAANDAGHAFSDPQGQDWDTAVCLQAIQMRQMHRKRKRSA